MRKTLTILLLFLTLSSQATIYFVKDDGNNANTGLSDAQAWLTLSKVSSFPFAPGDVIMFKRGDTFRGYLQIPTSGTAGNYITFGAYGTGAKPKIWGSSDASEATYWEDQGGNVWATASSVQSYWLDAGNIIFNNEASWGKRVWDYPDLDTQGDWLINRTTGIIFIYSVGNPGTFYTHIEISGYYHSEVITADGRDYIRIQDLDVRYSGNNGILPRLGSDHWIIERNNVSFIGGNQFMAGTARMGNGIGVWMNATDIVIRYNTISQCYDSGISPQGDPGYTQSNIQIYYNTIKQCFWNYEIWSVTTDVVSNLNFYNNVCLEPGLGWSTFPVLQRATTDDGQNARHFMGWQFTSTIPVSDIHIKNNIFQGNQTGIAAIRSGTGEALLDFDYNCFYDVDIVGLTDDGTFVTLANWQVGESQDLNSIDDDPLWVSSTDYHLNPDSPCINAGVDVGLTWDFDGTLIVGLPDIGVYEYLYGGPSLPTLTTAAITAITSSTATSGGNITSDGGAPVTQRGVCWNVSANPTIVDPRTIDGSGTGAFVSYLTGLVNGTTYHVRAYALNSAGYAYGEDRVFVAETGGAETIVLLKHTDKLIKIGTELIKR